MSLDIPVSENLREMFEEMIEEALWPANVTSAVDYFPTTRYESDSRLKGTADFSFYTSSSEYPLVAWYLESATDLPPEVCQTRLVQMMGAIRFAVRGESDIDNSAATASRVLQSDLATCSTVILAQLYDSNITAGPFGINAGTVTGKGTSRTYCVVAVETGEAEIEYAGGQTSGEDDEWGADDALGADVWIGTLPVTIRLYVR